MKKTNVSIRYSEFEELKKKNILFKSIKWIWIDNFTEIKIRSNFYKYLKGKKVKICLVSPELVKKNRSNEVKKLLIISEKINLKLMLFVQKDLNYGQDKI